MQSDIAPRSLGETCTRHHQINRHVENQGADRGDGRGVQSVEPRATHRDRVAGPRQSRTEKQRVPDGLAGIDGTAASAPGDAKGAEQDQHEADLFCCRKRLMQQDRGEKRDRERHDPGEERARMRCGSEHQARVREQDGGTAAEHDRRQSDPAEAF